MKKLIWLLLLLTLVACGPATITTPTVAPSPSSTPVPMATSTSMPTATSTPIAGAPIERCAEILPTFPEGSIPSGTLVIHFLGEELSLINLNQQVQRTIPGHVELYSPSTSPNGKWLSYTIFTPTDDGYNLVIESADGQRQIKIPVEEDWITFGPIAWLNNERLWLPVLKRSEGLQTIVLNPFTGEHQLLLPDYPNFISYYNGPGHVPLYFGNNSVVYDPSLRFVIYPLESDEHDIYAALWDRETNQMVTKIPNPSIYFGPFPIWLPSGDAFVVSAFQERSKSGEWTQEWWMVSRNGKINQLTHFENLYLHYEFGEAASLSPDGRYLAFGLYIGDPASNEPKELIILDLQTSEAINTCIPLYDSDLDPIWSPDSQYLAVRYRDLKSIGVLNIEQGWVVKAFMEEKKKWEFGGWLDSGE
jgi:Tol biopolymer transport system component